MTSKGVSRISVIKENINVQKYLKLILGSKLKSSKHNLFQDNHTFIFEQNSAPCHVATVHKKRFQGNHTPSLLESPLSVWREINLYWNGNSSDLIPNENLWRGLNKLASEKQTSNKAQLIELEAIIKS